MTDSPFLKILLLGDSAVGKRSIRNRIVTGEFQPEVKATIAGNMSIINLKVEGQEQPIKLILVTPPTGFGIQGRYAEALRGIRGLVLVNDIIRERTFDNLSLWLNDALKFSKDFSIAIVGNKVDLRDSLTETIDSDRGQKYADRIFDELNVPTIFMETSAKTGQNIHRLFSEFTEMIVDHRKIKLKAD